MNENQERVLKYLINRGDKYPIAAISDLSDLYLDDQVGEKYETWKALDSLNVEQELEVLKKYVEYKQDDDAKQPTQSQLNCPYCHGGRKAKPIVETSSDFLAFDKNGIVAFGNDGSVTTGEEYTKINYCPMCGRKLGDE